MRLSVASTGGATGSASSGKAACLRLLYSLQGARPSHLWGLGFEPGGSSYKNYKKRKTDGLPAITVVLEIADAVADIERVNNAAGGFVRGRR